MDHGTWHFNGLLVETQVLVADRGWHLPVGEVRVVGDEGLREDQKVNSLTLGVRNGVEDLLRASVTVEQNRG